MWVWSNLHVLLLLILTNVYEALCQEKSSLTFVIDNTYSMHDDISQVQVNADGITKIVFGKTASQVRNIVLVTFNDPGVRLVTTAENRTIFKRKVNSLSVRGGGDCPEMSMSGILQALHASLPGSFIYVFTDASAKDYFRSHEVENICQKKQSQIVFVLTGFCESRDEPMYQVYYDIAAACSGLTFDIKKREVTQVLSQIQAFGNIKINQ